LNDLVLIFGFGPGKAQDLGEVAPSVCPNCHNQVFLHHVQSKKSVRLYFVPVVPYGTDEYLLCPVCTQGLQISEAQRPYVQSMVNATKSYRARRLTEEQYVAQVQRFWAQLGVNPAGQQVLAPAHPATARAAPPTPNPPADSDSSLAGRLRQLAELHDQGVLTDEQYSAAKQRVIDAT
jgi:uncharacterized protein YbaR (Trm112 family)